MAELGDKLKKEFFKKLIPTIKIRQGGIYKVADDPENPIVKFPEDNLPTEHPKGKRTFHAQRYVLVIQDDKFNQDKNIISVQVIPLSSRGRDTPITITVPDDYLSEGILGPSIARLHLTQPILKVFLKEEVGFVPTNSETFKKVRAIYLRLIGLL
ncbi:MAG: type II toxin-antitoxin system PemK/MazF family toxin [bacterium]